MKNTYPITPEQQARLDSFTCERLSANRDNLGKIQTFHSYQGSRLVNYLRDVGWSEDTRGSTAYYVVKNPQNRVLLFFSLKCGTLFDPGYVDRCAKEFSETQRLLRAWNQAKFGDEEAKVYLQEVREKLGEEEYERRIRDLREDYDRQRDVCQQLKRDERKDPNDKMIRVDQSSSPSVMLVT